MTTPMFEQFHALKAENPDAILFFRMGDFYETFFEDAEIAAGVLELTLTSRNKQDPDPVPMAGVPFHAAAAYVQRLVDAGHKVAIAEQVEDPALARGLVRREVVRVVTPGIAWDPSAIEARSTSWLAGVAAPGRGLGLALLDVSTGDLRLTTVPDVDSLLDELDRHEPRELLLDPRLPAEARAAVERLRARSRAVTSEVEPQAWGLDEARAELLRLLDVADLSGFGAQRDEAGVAAAGALVRYARRRLGDRIGNVTRLRTWRPGSALVLDEATRSNLELLRPLRGDGRGRTLLGVLDRTVTAVGGRLLREWILSPLLDRTAITRRLDAVEALIRQASARAQARAALREVADIERLVARVTQQTATPRDLGGLRASLRAAPGLRAVLASVPNVAALLPSDVAADVADDLEAWLVDDPPPTAGEGGVLRRGAHAELDELVELATEGRGVIARLEAREREVSGIASVKIRHNQVFGYYLEVSRANLHRVPDRWIRRQTLANAERFVTPELKELEEKVLGADTRRAALELALFQALRERVAGAASRLLAIARGVAAIDVLAGLAEVADRGGWCRPEVVDDPVLDVEDGRHPVVEVALGDEPFVPNDVRLDPGRRLVVLTGPNMGGKSTVLRQTALHALLAQAGSFVPARRARVGVVDRLFCRVGASDDLARGQSTFMVEMAETASILHHATARSLVLLDEVGRGTSTYDGLSLAWAVAEDLAGRIGCRALFATHYHELCELAEELPGVANQSMAVRTHGDRIVFLRRLQEGGASRSYGLHCARLAGLPRPVVDRATTLLRHFEKHAPRDGRFQLSLFGTSGVEAPSEPVPDALRDALDALDPDTLPPREALAALYRLKALR